LEEELVKLLAEFDDVLAVFDERVQTRAPLQAPTPLETIQRIRKLRAGLDGGPARGESRLEQLWRAGLELHSLVEQLEDCAGEAFPRRATNLHGISEELVRLGKGDAAEL